MPIQGTHKGCDLDHNCLTADPIYKKANLNISEGTKNYLALYLDKVAFVII